MVSVAFVVTCVLIVVAPGPSFAVMVNQSLRNGRLGGLAAVLGNASGLVFWASASVFGLTALIRTSEFAFVALKVVGAAYLCWLGLRTLVRSRATAADDPVVLRTGGGGRLTAFRTGMVTNLANPKAAVLYLALLPQFLPAGGATLADTAVLAAVQMAISVSWYTLVVLAVGLVRRTLARPSVKARVEQISGLVLVGLGLRMITLSRAAL
ncbi:LysE family translocator [Pseudonocardia sp. Cha107L01]|uniref:LysE family translocator n=1 Tax=Pseudonocardia sp. Cha107L01 TaxID=3457576 RepID=UPI00403E5523